MAVLQVRPYEGDTDMKMDPDVIEILSKQEHDPFTAEEIKDLVEGSATFKLKSRADKVMGKITASLRLAVTRGDAMMMFVPRGEYEALKNRHAILNNTFMALMSALIKKGVVNDTEIGEAIEELTRERQ